MIRLMKIPARVREVGSEGEKESSRCSVCGLSSPRETMCQNKGRTPVVLLITAIPYTAIVPASSHLCRRKNFSHHLFPIRWNLVWSGSLRFPRSAATLDSFSRNDHLSYRLPSSRACEPVRLVHLCPQAESRKSVNPGTEFPHERHKSPIACHLACRHLFTRSSESRCRHHDAAAIDKYCCPQHAIYMENQMVSKDGMVGGPVAEVDLMIRRRTL